MDTKLHSNNSFFSLRLTKTTIIGAALAAASGLLASLVFPPYELWPLALVALVPLLLGLRRTSTVRGGGWLSLLFGIVFLGVTLRWLATIFGIGIIGVALLGSLPLVLFGLVYRLASARLSTVGLLLMTPVLWLTIDWLRCDGWYFRFSWAQLGFAFAAWPRGMRLYPLIGVYGVTFLIVLINAALAALLDRRAEPNARLISLGVATAALSVCLAAASLIRIPSPGVPVIVKAVQDESGDLGTLKELTLHHSPRKPALTVWPEYSVSEYPLSRPALLADLQQIARGSGSLLIVGCKEHAPPNAQCDWFRRRAMGDEPFYNSALLLGPKGNVIGTYHKTHPIQLFSDGIPGKSYPTFSSPLGKIGVAICYDLDFASDSLKLVRNGAQIIALPTFDPANWGSVQHTQHARMAQARAAEVGRWIVRATSSGVSQIISPQGRVTASLSGPFSGQITARAAFVESLTLYSRGMYLLPYLCIVASLVCLVALLFGRRKAV